MNIVEILLKELKVKHSKTFVEENYVNAPDSDNMLGIQRILSRYGIESVGVHFKNKEEAGLTFPCVLHWHDAFVVGIDLQDDTIKYHDGKNYITEAIPDFNKKWTGDMLCVTNMGSYHEPSYIKNKLIDLYNCFINYSLFAILICLGLFTIINNSLFNPQSINIIFDLIGFSVCLILFQKQLHAQSSIADKICSLLQNGGCDSILGSSEAKLWGIISWTEIGLAYFSSRILWGSLYESSLVLIQVIGWLAMPYGVWSIGYQAFKIKHWCTLCCLVQIIIWGSGIYNLFVFRPLSFSFTSITTNVMLGVIVFVVIQLISHYHTFYKQYNIVNKKFLNFKIQEGIFSEALTRSEVIDDKGEDSLIIYGSPTAKMTLTILTNPHCEPCANMHNRLMHLITKNPNINVKYIYTSFNKELEDSSLFCIAVYKQKPYDEAVKIMKKWYQYGRFQSKKFIKSYDINIHHPEVLNEYSRHKLWKERTGIDPTPTIVFSGHKLPNYYTVEDFEYLDVVSESYQHTFNIRKNHISG